MTIDRTDVLTPGQRHRCMQRVRSRDTKPELCLRRALWHAGMRYRLRRNLPGKPDLIFISARIAVFVDGCFWHRCPEHATHPKTNSRFWQDKLDGNVRRDRWVDATLSDEGWAVVRVWQHEIKRDLQGVVDRICAILRQANQQGATVED
ncbi:MAG: very short patch repair endonuclease [Chloroflexi bacterium]|nr:very short patch repair endonuclease [Chloroflexota bacterium]